MSSREKNIKLLEGLLSGERSLQDLLPPTFYFFVETTIEPGIYLCENNGKKYTPFEFEEFKKQLRPCDAIWQELRSY